MSALFLKPETGATFTDREAYATSLPVWLRLEPAGAIKTDRWVRLRYRSSYFDENVRPLLRLTDSAGASTIQPMNGTLFGVGEWVGYIPKDVSAISISPAARLGPFDFQIDSLETISPIHLLRRGLATNSLAVIWSMQAWCLGARAAARRGLKFAGSSSAFADYHVWQRGMSRAADLTGIDRPRADWDKTPAFHVFMAVDGGALAGLKATVQSLQKQIYRRWSLHCSIDEHCSVDPRREILAVLGDDARISATDDAAQFLAVARDFLNDDLCGVIGFGDTLPHYALAILAESAARYPQARAFYGDEDSISQSGRLHGPILRPDWSPYFQAVNRYIDGPIWLRACDLRRHADIKVARFVSGYGAVADAVLADCKVADVRHIRRVLCRRGREPVATAKQQQIGSRAQPAGHALAHYPEVTAVVLSRDNAGCLSDCIDGLLTRTDYRSLRITLVDNGSVKPDALDLLRDLKRNPKIDVLERPGPFNYSALCNDAAKASQSPLLLFLNDDIVMRDAGWLKPLIGWATRPDVGMAGAKLLFPNGSIQHAGVVVGMGAIAAHLYHKRSPRLAGYLNRLTVAHEVSAVTAACVAIERWKFNRVGGFDAVHLPVELNDIDLCLRLAEEGLSTIWTPESVLIHRESASRGETWSGDVYQAERDYFIGRWQSAIRDDRYFHPDLSLFSHTPALA